MAALSIRDLDDGVRDRLRVRAARHGRSMEAEIRAILTAAVLEPEEPLGLANAVTMQFKALGGVEVIYPERSTQPRAADFSA